MLSEIASARGRFSTTPRQSASPARCKAAATSVRSHGKPTVRSLYLRSRNGLRSPHLATLKAQVLRNEGKRGVKVTERWAKVEGGDPTRKWTAADSLWNLHDGTERAGGWKFSLRERRFARASPAITYVRDPPCVLHLWWSTSIARVVCFSRRTLIYCSTLNNVQFSFSAFLLGVAFLSLPPSRRFSSHSMH